MPATPALPITEAALLVVDAQRSFEADPDRWRRRNNPAFEANVTRLVERFRAAGRPVVWILHSDGDPFFERGSEWIRPMAFLEPAPGEEVVHKETRNAFTSTDLAQRLARRGVRRLAICGIQTEQCCETTARVAADLGYDVDFVTEATLTFPIRHVVDGVVVDEQPTEAIVRATEFALRGRFARLATVETLAAELAEAAPSLA